MNTQTIMWRVCLCLLPGLAMMSWTYGLGVVWNALGMVIACICIEHICASLVAGMQPLKLNTPNNATAALTGLLIAICLPPFTHIGILVTAALAAVALAKYAYGGVGRNLFNPAMVGYAAVLVSFPVFLADWSAGPIALPFGETTTATAGASALPSSGADALSGATLLSEFRYREGMTVLEFDAAFADQLDQQLMIALAFALGGGIMLYWKIIRWQLPAGVCLGITLGGIAGFDQGSSTSMGSAWFHLITGGAIAGAFFVATDPVTHPVNPRHHLLWGTGIGLLTYLIRGLGSYPDGFAFAVLLANCVTPLLNRWYRTQLSAPKVTADG